MSQNPFGNRQQRRAMAALMRSAEYRQQTRPVALAMRVIDQWRWWEGMRRWLPLLDTDPGPLDAQ